VAGHTPCVGRCVRVTSTLFAGLVGFATAVAMVLAGEATALVRTDRSLSLIETERPDPGDKRLGILRITAGRLRLVTSSRVRGGRGGLVWVGVLGPPAAALGWALAGPAGLILGVALAGSAPRAFQQRAVGERRWKAERQLADVVETCALAVRAGLSIGQSLEYAAGEAEPPVDDLLRRLIEEQRVGASFEVALQHFADAFDTDDARLFVLVVTTHARSGGNLAGALDEVTATIRHRLDVRRELRALSAQGRVSGAILGSLPIAFFLVLAVTSHRELGPVYRSGAGIGMVLAGLALEGVAYAWIRRLMRVES